MAVVVTVIAIVIVVVIKIVIAIAIVKVVMSPYINVCFYSPVSLSNSRFTLPHASC